MSAPTVIRPSASVVDEPAPGQSSAANVEWSQYIKWGLVGALALAAIGLISSLYVTHAENSHTEKLRGEWDEYHNAITEKKSDDERIDALEKLADDPKIKGTTVHAYVLATLAHTNFEIAQNPRRQVEARGAALDRSILLNRMLATTEPFKSHPSFGPIAVSNLALSLEQKQVNDASTQYYDEAIKTLHGALYKDESKDADPVSEMKKHFLFDKMNAQLGRLYWLRGLRLVELDAGKNPDAAKKDNEWALFYIKKALEAGISSVEKMRYGDDFKGYWREEAAYVKSLIDPAGRMMPDGKAPAMKLEAKSAVSIAAAPAGAVAPDKTATITTTAPHALSVGQTVLIAGVGTSGFNGTFTIVAVPTPTSFTYAVPAALAASGGGTVTVSDVKKDDVKKEDVKKEEPKKDEPKKDEPKKDAEKKTGSLQSNASQESIASETGGSSQHLSYAQIQAMLKQGRPALCQCARCANSDKAIGAKLAE